MLLNYSFLVTVYLFCLQEDKSSGETLELKVVNCSLPPHFKSCSAHSTEVQTLENP